jgi:Ca2+-dependent lipid-binding protein
MSTLQLNPSFEETFVYDVRSTANDELTIKVMDWDRIGKHDPLGDLTVSTASVSANNDKSQRTIHF